MSKYELVYVHKKRDDYELNIKDLTDNQTYPIFLIKLNDKIEKINEYKKGRMDLNYKKDRMIGTNREEVYVNNIPSNLQNEEFYTFLLQYDGYIIRFFDEEDITYDMCLEAIKNQPFSLRHIPKKYINDEIIDTAIGINGYSIMYVEDNKRTDERCISAYNNCARALRFLPKNLVTYEICVEAVNRDMFCIHYVPDKYLLKIYREEILNKGLDIPKKGVSGVLNTQAELYRDVKEKIDGLLQNNAIDNAISNMGEEDKYEWLLQKREQLLCELTEIEYKLYDIEKTKGYKHK